MEVALEIVSLVAAVLLLAGTARRLGVSAPPGLVVAGVVGSFIPGIPAYDLDPDLVLVGILPPLLYAAALRTSVVDVRRDKRAIGLLSVGLVAFSAVGVGLVATWLIPGLPLAAGFALGAVVAPPDAVAATAVARRVGLPRRIVNILEGESLVNDATALVALRTSVVAIAGSVTVLRAGFEFAVAIVGGVVVGLLVAKLLTAVRHRVNDVVIDTTISFLAPFAAFIAAEEVSVDGAHPSGVLAVVITGLVLGHRSGDVQSASARVAEQANWRTVQFVLENGVFLLIGLQLATVVEDVSDTGIGIGRLVVICAAVLGTAVAARLLWVYPATYLPRLIIPAIGRADPGPPLTYPLVVAWAGMRGVVTLAAVFTLPPDTPQRPVLVLAAFVVVAGTLLVQGSTLPALVRRLRLPPPDPAEDALAEASALQQAAQAGNARLEELRDEVPREIVGRLRERSFDRANVAWERLGPQAGSETPTEAYRRVRMEMLAAERDAVARLRDERRVDSEVLRGVLAQLDLEESFLDTKADDVDTSVGDLLHSASMPGCRHLEEAGEQPVPDGPACPRCLEEGLDWVHLRMCLGCGQVGCCDSSPGRHAEAHSGTAGHPVMRSVERGEAWRWCYVDEQLG